MGTPHLGSSLESLFDELGEREEFELFVQQKKLAMECKRMHYLLGDLHLDEMMQGIFGALALCDPQDRNIYLSQFLKELLALGLLDQIHLDLGKFRKR